ncbi:MAG: hypothetical protein ABSF67_15145 [Roseiarcus sp.]|jgi:hypothetical protein
MAAVSPRNLEQLLAAERMRVSAILESEEGRKRPALAMELALRSPMSVDAATALLSKAAVESRNASAAEAFARALSAEAIGVTSLGADTIGGDVKEKRIAEIKRNVGKKGQRND